MPITTEIIQAYAVCPRKAFLSLHPDPGSASRASHPYVQILEQRASVNRARHMEAIQQQFRDARPYDPNLLGDGRSALIDAIIRTGDLEAHCDSLSKVKAKSLLGRYGYEPTIVVGTQSLTLEQKTAISFAGYVLGQIQHHLPAAGTLVNREGQTRRIHLTGSYKNIGTMIDAMRGWLANSSVEPPPIVLNKNCPYCPFRNECTERAIKDSNLSLLDRMTPKLIKKYQKRGIFTVQQLSFLFRPKRSRKKPRCAKFSPELQALALRTNKTYLNEIPSYERPPVEIFLDIEGIPDERFNYLIGILIVNRGSAAVYQSFWADSRDHEQRVWSELLAAIAPYPGAPIYHYGTYEAKAIRHFDQCYGGAPEVLTKRLVNVNSWIYGKIYFPVRSNRLKDLGKFLGTQWSSPEASGLQALVWRHRWEETGDDHYKRSLLIYNQEDCRALSLLVETVSDLKNRIEINPAVDLADLPKKPATGTGEEIHKQFDWICRSARADYDRTKISLRRRASSNDLKGEEGGRKGPPRYKRLIPRRAGRIIQLRARRNCPRHDGSPLEKTGRIAARTVIDLAFSKNGCRKTIVKYQGPIVYCSKCGHDYRRAVLLNLARIDGLGARFKPGLSTKELFFDCHIHL
jgi:predicted RecB family nuclease